MDHGKNRECIFNSMVMVDGANVMALKSAARGTSPLSERLRLAAAFHTSLPCLQLHLKKKNSQFIDTLYSLTIQST